MIIILYKTCCYFLFVVIDDDDDDVAWRDVVVDVGVIVHTSHDSLAKLFYHYYHYISDKREP